MADFPYSNFDALFNDMLRAYWDGDVQRAHDLVVAGIDYLPRENTRFLRFVQSMLLARLGDADLALDVLYDLIEGGYWATEHYWLDGDFDSIRNEAEFERLHALSSARLKAAQIAARPELFTFSDLIHNFLYLRLRDNNFKPASIGSPPLKFNISLKITEISVLHKTLIVRDPRQRIHTD